MIFGPFKSKKNIVLCPRNNWKFYFFLWKLRRFEERKPKIILLVTGAEGVFIDQKSPNNGNIEGLNFSSAYQTMPNDKWDSKIPVNIRQNFIQNFSPTTSIHQVTNMIDDNSRKWAALSFDRQHMSRSPPPSDYESRRNPLRSPLQPHPQMSYHNMFTPSSEPGSLWRCRSCGKEVTNRWHHFHSHTAQRSLCPYCPATYSRIDTLRSHLKQKHRHEISSQKGSQS